MINMELIGDVIDIAYDIYMIYLELFGLEVRGNKENSRYMSLIKTLKEKINEEKELYELLAQDRESYDMLFDYVKRKPTQMLYLRMYSYMIFNDDNAIEDEDNRFRSIYSACNIDLFLVYLSFLQDCIDDESLSSVKDGLIYTKYYNSFINLDLEESLIENKFEVCKVNYAKAYFVSNILLMDKNITEEEILDYYRDAIAVALVGLLNIVDLEYDNEDRMVDVISSECMLRASLSMLSNGQYEVLKEGIYKVINDLSTGENGKSVCIVNSIINGRVKDKSMVKRIYTRGFSK